jgi:hypothetical protein
LTFDRLDERILLSSGEACSASLVSPLMKPAHVAGPNDSALVGRKRLSLASATTTLAEKCTPPAAPAFTATAVSATQIDLKWNRVAGASCYLVDELDNGVWTQVASVGRAGTSDAINGLSPGITYCFNVGAFRAQRTTWANPQSATTFQNNADANDPTALVAYSPVSGSLFGADGPSYQDVEQGDVGDCWLLAGLAEVAARTPSEIENMFTYDGSTVENGSVVGIYTVRFFNYAGRAQYVTVDTELPAGGAFYDSPANGVLWTALAEKAYAEANAAGFVTTSHMGRNSYAALDGGDPVWALQAITGKPARDFSIKPRNLGAAWNDGQLIVLSTSTPVSSHVVSSHSYAVVGYSASSAKPFEVYNPWGTTSSGTAQGDPSVYGLFFADGTFLARNFAWQSLGTGAPARLRAVCA